MMQSASFRHFFATIAGTDHRYLIESIVFGEILMDMYDVFFGIPYERVGIPFVGHEMSLVGAFSMAGKIDAQ